MRFHQLGLTVTERKVSIAFSTRQFFSIEEFKKTAGSPDFRFNPAVIAIKVFAYMSRVYMRQVSIDAWSTLITLVLLSCQKINALKKQTTYNMSSFWTSCLAMEWSDSKNFIALAQRSLLV